MRANRANKTLRAKVKELEAKRIELLQELACMDQRLKKECEYSHNVVADREQVMKRLQETADRLRQTAATLDQTSAVLAVLILHRGGSVEITNKVLQTEGKAMLLSQVDHTRDTVKIIALRREENVRSQPKAACHRESDGCARPAADRACVSLGSEETRK